MSVQVGLFLLGVLVGAGGVAFTVRRVVRSVFQAHALQKETLQALFRRESDRQAELERLHVALRDLCVSAKRGDRS